MKKNLFILAIMAISLVACNKENAGISPKHEEMLGNGLKYIEIVVSQERPIETKAVFGTGENQTKMYFGEGDQIAVIANGSPATLTYLRKEGDNIVFGGTVDEDAEIGLYAYYPASIATSTELTINWPTSVDGSKAQVPMVAYLNKEANSATFKHLGAIAIIGTDNTPTGATKLKFTAANNITGTFTINNFTTGTPTLTPSGDPDGKTITATISGDDTYYIPLPAGTYAGFQLAMINGDDTFYYKQRTAKSGTSLALARGNIVLLEELSYDLDEIEEWYMVCANQASPWTVSDKSIRMIKIGENQYRNATNNGRWASDYDDTRGYKIADASASSWSDVYGNSTAYQLSGTLTKGADKNCFWGEDGYKIYAGTINTSSYSYSNEWKAEADGYSYSDLKMVGDFNSWDKDTGGYSFTKTAAHNWKMTSTLTVSSNQKVEFKLITASQWDYGNWGGVSITDAQPYGTCTSRGSGSDPDTARSSYTLTQGSYDVYFNDVTADIMFVRVYPPAKSTTLEDMSLSAEYNI